MNIQRVPMRCLHARCQCLSPVSPDSMLVLTMLYDPGSPGLMMCGQK